MDTTYRDDRSRARRGSGSRRERRPGVWEIRVVVANDPVTGRSVQRSFTVHGDAPFAEGCRKELVRRFGLDRRALCCAGARWSVGDLLDGWVTADHAWRPATRSSSPSVTRFLGKDRIGKIGLAVVVPADVEAAFARWRGSGASVATVWARWAVLHSALSWAVAQRILRAHPLGAMRGPPRAMPRMHLSVSEIGVLLVTAAGQVAKAEEVWRNNPSDGHLVERLFNADQTRLLVRLAADTGARRGELAVLRLSDLEGRVLSIERNLSLEVLGPTKSKRSRRLTLGARTTAMVVEHFECWEQRVRSDAVAGDWVFAPDYRRLTHARADLLSHRFERLRRAAGLPEAALHRLRHSLGTQLVSEGKILKAQARLGHRDPATTLRHYAHALPLADQDVADTIDHRLNDCEVERDR